MENIYKVIIAEDEERILNNIVKKINQANMGFKVVGQAQTGKQALLLVEELGPDVVFTDIKMPVMDGLELLENLYFSYPYIKTVIISGYAEFEYAQRAIIYNVKNYLLKPIEMEELLKTLNRLKILIDTERRILKEKFLISEALHETKDIVYIIREYIKEHYTEEINFNFIAESVHYSSSYLTRIFTQHIGVSPSKYLIDLRINRAKYLLKNHKELSIKQVSEAIGYPDQSYFSRLFKRIVGKSPVEYREDL
jgi:YesN/AraC family two-component response regulator